MTGTSPRLAVVGCGAIAERFYRPALERSRLDGDQLAFVDTDPDRAEEVAAGFDGATVVTDHEAVVDAVDGAIVAVPHHLHHPIATDFVTAGADVLVEKPLAVTAENAEDIVETADREGVAVGVNNTRRLFPGMIRMREFLRDRELGNPVSVRMEEGDEFDWPTSSGFYFTGDDPKGVLLDRGAHALDLVCWWFDEVPTLRSCRYDARGGSEAVARVEFEVGGTPGELTLSWLGPFDEGYRVECADGTALVDPYDWRRFEVRRDGHTDRRSLDSEESTYYEFGDTLVGNFLDVIAGDATPLVPGREVVDSIRFIEECYDEAEPFDAPWLTPTENGTGPGEGSTASATAGDSSDGSATDVAVDEPREDGGRTEEYERGPDDSGGEPESDAAADDPGGESA